MDEGWEGEGRMEGERKERGRREEGRGGREEALAFKLVPSTML